MIDLRAYSDVLFRVDEVLQNKMQKWFKFDDRFFYSQNDTNRAFLAFMFDVEPKSRSIEETKELLKEPIKTYFNEGTFEALDKALKDLYSNTKVKEWFSYEGEPYHFKLELDASKNGISLDTLKKSDEIVQAYKNVRSVYDGATIKLTSTIDAYAGGVNFIGEQMTIYPYQTQNLSISAKEHIGGYVKLAEIITPQTLNLKGELR